MALRIGIAGAGVLGRLLAFTLSRAGHAVQVFDPACGPGPRADSGSQAAGWTAAGMLSPVAELERAGDQVLIGASEITAAKMPSTGPTVTSTASLLGRIGVGA